MSLIHQYILEFNKLVCNISFLSCSNEVTIKNKLFLIQQDINEDVDFDSFECHNFFSNIYNILNQSSDPKSAIVGSCVDVLQKSINSRNKAIMKIFKDINFLPSVTKLLWHVSEENFSDDLLKLLVLIKNLIMLNNELDEHNLKVFITSLRDLIENFSNEKVTKLSLQILANLAMHNEIAKYLISKSIKTTEVQEKINKSPDLIAMKFLITAYGDFLPKDFMHLMKLSIKNIKESVCCFDSEPLIHSIDLLRYAKQIFNEGRFFISEMENVLGLLEELNEKLINQFSDEKPSKLKDEFLDNVFDYFCLLLEFDNKLVHYLENFTEHMFDNSRFSKSSSGLKYLSAYITFGGTFNSMDKCIEDIIEYFNENFDLNTKIIGKSQKYEFIKFLTVLHRNEKLDNTHFKSALEYMENILSVFENFDVQHIDEDVILLLVYSLQTLYALSQDSSLFKECLDKILEMKILPCLIAKAYLMRNEEILQILFSLTSMEKFPNAQVASILSKTVFTNEQAKNSHKEVRNRCETSNTSKYITGHLLDELDELIKRINQKLDNDDEKGLKASDIISLYRQKNSYLQDHLTTVTESLHKYSDLYNEMQQQNSVLRKLGEKHEIGNWALQLDKERYLMENQKLEAKNSQLAASIAAFRTKIDKEITTTLQIQKQMTIKDMELESKLAIEYYNFYIFFIYHI